MILLMFTSILFIIALHQTNRVLWAIIWYVQHDKLDEFHSWEPAVMCLWWGIFYFLTHL
jgi:hypothetical protein